MKFQVIVGYEYPIEHKIPVKAELILHGDRVVTDNIKPVIRENVHGKWIYQHDDDGNSYYGCSNCGAKAGCDWESVVYDGRCNEPDMSNFCPNCGADMRGEKE